MKKVFLLIVLSCLFISCKNHVSSNQGNNQEEELLPTQVKIINENTYSKITNVSMVFSNTNTKNKTEIDFSDSELNYKQSKIFDLPEIPEGFVPMYFRVTITKENDINPSIIACGEFIPLFYSVNTNNQYSLKDNKKLLTFTLYGELHPSVK